MDWIQTLTIIGSVPVPMLSGFSWIIHRMDQKFDKVDQKFDRVDVELHRINDRFDKMSDRINLIEIKMTNLDMRVGFIEKLFEMMGGPFKIGLKERTDP